MQEQTPPSGRRGIGTVNHCMHGADAMVEEILDWRPYDYLTDRTTMPHGGPVFMSTYEFEPTATGTRTTLRISRPKKKADMAVMEQLAPMLEQGIRASVDVLLSEVGVATAALTAERAEPSLPTARNSDGFLEGIQPIQFVD